ncbi:MAG: hypothetical protein LBP67_04465 [Bacteroidales bacterium]|nr:hypothetical protein [Bacteroidales bacterium]
MINNKITVDNKKIEEDMNNFFSAKKLWDVLWKRKFHIIIITIVGIVIGVIFSSPKFITPRYKSVAVVYPSNISEYSEESPSEQLYQWFLSTDIKWKVIEEFNLYEHYKIDKNAPKSLTYILNEYNRNVRIEQNSYEAINIIVYDKDPQIACDMVNAIINFIDIKIRNVHKEKFQEVISVYEKTHEWSLDNLNNISSQLEDLGTDNNILYALSRALGMDAKKANNDQSSSSSSISIDNYGPDYINNLLQLITLNKSMEEFWDRYFYAYSNLQKEFTYTSILTHPYPADKKSTPVRWVIVLFAAAAAFLISYVGFVIAENIPTKKIVKKRVYR